MAIDLSTAQDDIMVTASSTKGQYLLIKIYCPVQSLSLKSDFIERSDIFHDQQYAS